MRPASAAGGPPSGRIVVLFTSCATTASKDRLSRSASRPSTRARCERGDGGRWRRWERVTCRERVTCHGPRGRREGAARLHDGQRAVVDSARVVPSSHGDEALELLHTLRRHDLDSDDFHQGVQQCCCRTRQLNRPHRHVALKNLQRGVPLLRELLRARPRIRELQERDHLVGGQQSVLLDFGMSSWPPTREQIGSEDRHWAAASRVAVPLRHEDLIQQIRVIEARSTEACEEVLLLQLHRG